MMLSRLNRATGTSDQGQRSSCGLWCFLFCFMLLLHVPSVTWTSMMVFLLGPYTEDGKLDGYEGLECDPRFWKVTFRLMIALIAYDTIIIIFLLAEGVKGLCSALICCCCCCNRSDDSNNSNNKIKQQNPTTKIQQQNQPNKINPKIKPNQFQQQNQPEVDFFKTSQEILV